MPGLLSALLAGVWAFAAAGQEAAVDTAPAAAAAVADEAEEDVPEAPAADWSGAAALKERIEGEIVELEALAAAQDTLIEWNRSRAAIGLEPAGLSREVCLGEALEAWCRLLPATFGEVPPTGAGGWAGGWR